MLINKLLLLSTSFILYGILLLTIASFFFKDFSLSLNKIKKRRELLSDRGTNKKNNLLNIHLEKILNTVSPFKITTLAFKTITATIFIIIFSIAYKNFNILTTIFASVFIAFLPYTILRIKALNIKAKSSYEAENLVSLLLNQYRMNSYNIYEALEKTIQTGTDIKECKKIIYKMLVEIRNSKNNNSIREAIERFSKTIDTKWSRMLGNCIYIATSQGIDVSLSLEDILVQLKEAKSILEDRKRINAETIRIVKFIIPILYVGSIFLANNFMGIPLNNLLANQFYTSEGVTLFLLILSSFIVNIILVEVLKNKKFDF